MGRHRGHISLLALVFVLALSLGVFGASSSPRDAGRYGGDRYGGVLRVAINAEPPGFDLQIHTAQIAFTIGQHVFETLFTLNARKQFVPFLLDSYTVDADSRTFTFKVRAGVRFHTGAEMTSADVLASLQRWQRVSGRGRQLLANLTGATAPDATTVTLVFSQPNGALISALAIPTQGMVVLPREIIDRNRGADGRDRELKGADLIGTGPYRLAEWLPDRYTRLVRFREYTHRNDPANGMAGNRSAYADEIRFIPVPDNLTRLAGLISGEYDLANPLVPDMYDRVQRTPALVGQVVGPGGGVVAVFNKRRGPFVDVRMRQAAWYATDPKQVMMAVSENNVFYRLTPALAGTEWGVWNFPNVGSDVYGHGRDPERAQALMREAGYRGEPIRWITTRDFAYMDRSSQIAAEQMKRAGLNVELVVSDWATVIADRNRPERYEIFSTGISFLGDPTATAAFTPTWPGWYESSRNTSNYQSLVQETNAQRRRELAREQQRIFWDEIPYMQWGELLQFRAHRRAVQNVPTDNLYVLWNAWLDKR